MSTELLIRAPLGLLPVVIFLFVLLYMDSYKLLRLRSVLWVILAGSILPIIAYAIHGFLMDTMQIEYRAIIRYGAPVSEEILKALIIIMLFRTHRIGFLVDSAIMGFAAGTGFAFVENLYYLRDAGDAHIAVWVVRGFGTAIMHGGVTAIFAILSQTLTERHMNINPVLYLPGLMVAIGLHSAFNHFVLPPLQMTLCILLSLPPVLYLVFKKSSSHLHEWLELDFDADAILVQQINSGEFSTTKIGLFLQDLRDRFEGTVVVDMLCYLRLYTELALRAKGMLLMRENGFDTPVGERTRAKFAELEYLENSIGKTGVLAMRPFLQMSRKDLWQLYVLAERT
jgi:RsiW-degrading membrane proteinase PrsW (M82 family)